MYQLSIRVVEEIFEVLKASACAFQQPFVTSSVIRERHISLSYGNRTKDKCIFNISVEGIAFFDKTPPRLITFNGPRSNT